MRLSQIDQRACISEPHETPSSPLSTRERSIGGYAAFSVDALESAAKAVSSVTLVGMDRDDATGEYQRAARDACVAAIDDLIAGLEE
jgi:hypothetical protein